VRSPKGPIDVEILPHYSCLHHHSSRRDVTPFPVFIAQRKCIIISHIGVKHGCPLGAEVLIGFHTPSPDASNLQQERRKERKKERKKERM
jgi:carbonic anhydrase/acetyltransferase-like protein (isoleucine patch superfamily)